jgi:pilus assembly protein CpaB
MQLPKIREKLPFIIAISCGILALLLMNSYMQGREAEVLRKVKQMKAQAQPSQPQQKIGIVLVAQRDILPQTPITTEDLLIKEMPEEYIQPGAVTSLESVIGQISSVSINTGEQILRTKLLTPGKVSKTLSEITPEGKRAVTVIADNLANLSGMLQPGDSVDVHVTLTPPASSSKASQVGLNQRIVPLFQDVKILAVGSDFSNASPTTKKEQAKSSTTGSGSSGVGTVTLALSPQEAILLAFVQEQQGKIKLVLRSSEDKKIETVKPADWDALIQYLYPSSVTQQGAQPVVEIYRGQQKEVVPLSEGKKKE